MPKKRSFWERYAYSQLSGNSNSQAAEQLYMLSEKELTALRKIRMNTYLKIGLAGALSVILLTRLIIYFT